MAGKDSKMDLDLIQMVQKARMANDQQATPSQLSAVYWIEAKSPVGRPTPRAGKWVIPTTVDEVDVVWKKIKSATEDGQLGYKSKVSTSPGKDQAATSARQIHVRVGDSDDTSHVQQIRETLRKLGITQEIHYQRDAES